MGWHSVCNNALCTAEEKLNAREQEMYEGMMDSACVGSGDSLLHPSNLCPCSLCCRIYADSEDEESSSSDETAYAQYLAAGHDPSSLISIMLGSQTETHWHRYQTEEWEDC
eukprot:3931718-Rhodomonas_salina.2